MSDTQKEVRTELSFRIAAMEYVDTQLATMGKYGSAPILSPGEYNGLVEEMEKIGRKLWLASGGEIANG